MIKDIEEIDEMEGYFLIINCINNYISNNPEKITWTFSYKTLKQMAEGLLQNVDTDWIAGFYEEYGCVVDVDEVGKLVIMLSENANEYFKRKSINKMLSKYCGEYAIKSSSKSKTTCGIGLWARFPNGAIIQM